MMTDIKVLPLSYKFARSKSINEIALEVASVNDEMLSMLRASEQYHERCIGAYNG